MNDYLYGLIQELDKQERMHITNTLKNYKGDSILLYFFNYLCNQKKIDEKKIKSTIRNATIKKYYAQYKRKLYDAILKAMRQYSSGQVFDKQLYDLLKDITFLFEKGRMSEAYDLIEKGIKKAHEHQIFELELIFYKWKLMLASTVPALTNKREVYNQLQIDIKKCIDMNNGLYTNKLKHYHYLFEKKNVILNLPPKNRGIAAKKLLKELDLKLDDSLPPEINYGTHMLHYQIYLLDRDLEKVKYHLEKALDYIKIKPFKEVRDYYNYTIGLANLIEIAFVHRDEKEMKLLLEDFLRVNDKYGNKTLVRDLLKNYIPLFQLHYAILINEYDNEDIVAKIEIQINDEKNRKSTRSTLCLALATYFYLQEERSKALDFILRFKDFEDQSVHVYAYKFLEMIIYYEMDEYQLLESKIRSLYRYLSDQDQYDEVERAILKALRKGINTKAKSETKNILSNLLERLKKNKRNASTIELRYIYFEEWLEATLNNQSIQTYLKQRNSLKNTT